MEPNRTSIPRSRAGAWVLIGGALTAAVLFASQTYLSMLHHGHDWWRLFGWQLASWLFWAACAPWLLSRGAQASEGISRWWLFTQGMACAVLVGLHVAISAGALVLLQPFVPVETMGFGRALSYLFVPWAFVDVLLFWLFVGIGSLLASRRRHRELLLRESRLETELVRAQLDNLRLKIEPHFLFNALNSIAALIKKRDNEEAYAMLVELAELLRASLERFDAPFVALSEEIDFVDRYIGLQLRRFGHRLEYRRRVEAGLENLKIPSLILQPLVENSIRHGIAKSGALGLIEVVVDREVEGHLRLRVEDNGPGLPAEFSLEDAQGVGLAGTRSRLEVLYGERAFLSLRRREGGGTVAEIRLPVDSVPAGLELPTALTTS